jgi:hypothetical protein
MDPTTMVPTIKIPAPRLLPPDMPPQDQAQVLAECYRKAIAARGVKSYALLQGNPTAWKQYPGMLRCAEALRSAKIPPAAWCLFRFDRHRAAGLPGNPRVASVWSALAVVNRSDWYEIHRTKYEGPREVMAPLHAALCQDWRRMTMPLLDPCEKSYLAAVECWFPGDSFSLRIEAAVTEAGRLQRVVDAEAKRGLLAGW